MGPGLCHESIYQKNGDPKRVAQLLEEFTRDARNVKLRVQDHQLEDVTDTLKAFLSNSEDALLAKELYPYWISALGKYLYRNTCLGLLYFISMVNYFGNNYKIINFWRH